MAANGKPYPFGTGAELFSGPNLSELTGDASAAAGSSGSPVDSGLNFSLCSRAFVFLPHTAWEYDTKEVPASCTSDTAA